MVGLGNGVGVAVGDAVGAAVGVCIGVTGGIGEDGTPGVGVGVGAALIGPLSEYAAATSPEIKNRLKPIVKATFLNILNLLCLVTRRFKRENRVKRIHLHIKERRNHCANPIYRV